MVAEEVVQLRHRRRDVGIADTVDHVERLTGMQVVQLQLIPLAVFGQQQIVNRKRPRHQQHAWHERQFGRVTQSMPTHSRTACRS